MAQQKKSKLNLRSFVRNNLLWLFCLILGSPIARAADNLNYDLYAPTFKKEPKAAPLLKDVSTHFLVYPLEILRWPVDRGLIYIEKHHIDRKTLWLYDKLVEEGVTPHLEIGRAHV